MSTVLSTAQSLVERTIYKVLRGITVEHGYIPDITLYPNTNQGKADYDAAVTAIKNSDKKFAIEVFGHSNSQAKGNKQIPRIVIRPRRIIEGGIGPAMGKTFELNEGGATFSAFTVSGAVSNMHIEVRLVSGTAEQHRILHAILMAALNFRGYLEFYDNSGSMFYRWIGYDDEENTIEGQMENIYTYEVVDIDMTPRTILNAEVAKIVEITAEIYSGTYFPDGNFNPLDFQKEDTIVVT